MKPACPDQAYATATARARAGRARPPALAPSAGASRTARASASGRAIRAGRGPPGHLVWVHGASIGETLSLLPVVERLTQRGLSVLVTSGTRTSAAFARRLPPGALHQFVPLDVPRYVRRFLDHWQPDLALVAESEIWPNTVLELDRARMPLVLVNGRMSDRSFRRWQRLPRIIGALLERFALCLAQTHDDAERLARLGAPRVVVAGNLKFDVPPPPADPRAVAQLSGLIAGRPVWLAASTHPGEEKRHRRRPPGARAALPAPPHHHRAAPPASRARRSPASPASRAARRPALGGHAAGPGDRRLRRRHGRRDGAVLPLVARSSSWAARWCAHGGQNPIEPAKLGAAILHGPARAQFERDLCRPSTRRAARCWSRTARSLARARERAAERRRADPRDGARRRRMPCRRSAARSSAPCSRSSPSSFRRSSGRGADAGAGLLVARAPSPLSTAASARPASSTARSPAGACAGAGQRAACRSSASAISPPAAPARRRRPSRSRSLLRGVGRNAGLPVARLWRQRAGPLRVEPRHTARRGRRRTAAPRRVALRHRVARPAGRRAAGGAKRRDRDRHGRRAAEPVARKGSAPSRWSTARRASATALPLPAGPLRAPHGGAMAAVDAVAGDRRRVRRRDASRARPPSTAKARLRGPARAR